MGEIVVERPIRILVAKPGLDGHDRGALIVAQGLRDAGMEVIYTGLRQTVEQIVQTAIQEDVDCIGLSSLSGAHMALFPAVVNELKQRGIHDVLVIGGGVIPPDDVRQLKALGIAEVFTPGSTISDMANYIRAHVKPKTWDEPFETPSQIDHIGIAVRNMKEALSLYENLLGFTVIHEETIEDQNVHAIFVEVGDVHIELLESTSEDGPIARYLAAKGPGIHHIAYRVQNVEHWIARARQAGYQLIDEAPRSGGQNKRIAFVHPKSTQGVLTEFCELI
ncbi:methylmalonyl-CoA epimerase [Sulfoacidibacillus thermotolerans]|uniref:Methylmalonyl-CoA epimerase n=1 Tax=Sulfoacidibacillus thermotolerans TaxID=1765684 RepID=A0A2U3D6U4_SULT2|nr:methylmalonyl-CoA epimerase [Sulfoacidibacillus thermotolerans]